MAYSLFTDGGARGNPGPAGIGIVLLDEHNKVVYEHCDYLGKKTNNEAEYTALLTGLQLSAKQNVRELNCYLDSELVVKQLRGEYKIRNHNLKLFFDQIKEFEPYFSQISYNHVKREKNKRADELVNLAIDNHVKQK